MATDALIHALRHIAMFDGLSPLQITEIARRADRIVYKPGSRITQAHQPADAAIVLVSGTAERIEGPGLADQSQPLPAGTIIAEMAMLIETVTASTVVAVTEVRALRIARDEMHELIAEDPALAEHFVGKAAGRLRDVAGQLREIENCLARASSASFRAVTSCLIATKLTIALSSPLTGVMVISSV